jgi:hypothetical protein
LSKRVAIVVPTLGKRSEYLRECLASIRQAGVAAGRAHIVLVCPDSFESERFLKSGLVDQIVKDPELG